MASYPKKRIPLLLELYFKRQTDETHFVRTSDIIDHLAANGVDIERRAVYDNIRLLDECGIKIQTHKERGGCKYNNVEKQFSAAELKMLVDAVAASKFLTEKASKELIAKIKDLGSVHQARQLDRSVILDNRIKSMDDVILKNLDVIYAAITNNSKISFQYRKWNNKRQLENDGRGRRQVSPYAVALNDGNYYLIAVSHYHKRINYRIDRMSAVREEAEPREDWEEYKRFNVIEYMRQTFGMYEGTKGAETVIMVADDRLTGVFVERFGRDSVRLEMGEKGKIHIRTNINVSPQFYGWIAGLGGGVEIKSPAWVREGFINHLQEIESRYLS